MRMGQAVPRVDIPSKTDGSAIFGIDVKVPNLAFAAIRRCPVPGGQVKSYDKAALKKPGIIEVVEIPGGLAVPDPPQQAGRRLQAAVAVDDPLAGQLPDRHGGQRPARSHRSAHPAGRRQASGQRAG